MGFLLKDMICRKKILFFDADNFSAYQNGKNCHHSKSNNSKDICIFNNDNNKKKTSIYFW